jgi:multidrug resistance protein MdtO
MVTARDRVIGILIGNLVCYVVFVVVWPVSVASRVDPALRALTRKLGDLVSAGGIQARRALATQALADYGAVEHDLGLVAFEPKEIRPGRAWLESRRRVAEEVSALTGPLLLSADRSPPLAASFAQRMGALADALEGPASGPFSTRAQDRPDAASTGPTTLKALVDSRLASLERAIAQDAATERTGDHVPA